MPLVVSEMLDVDRRIKMEQLADVTLHGFGAVLLHQILRGVTNGPRLHSHIGDKSKGRNGF